MPLILLRARLTSSVGSHDFFFCGHSIHDLIFFPFGCRWLLAPNAAGLARSSEPSVYCEGINLALPALARYLARVLRCFVVSCTLYFGDKRVQCTRTAVQGLVIYKTSALCPTSGSNAVTMPVSRIKTFTAVHRVVSLCRYPSDSSHTAVLNCSTRATVSRRKIPVRHALLL